VNANLNEIIQMNGIDVEVLYDALHKDILESILSEVCEYMKASDSSYILVKKIYYQSTSDIDAIKRVVRNICHISLPEQDYKWLNDCIKAFMKKKPHRKQISDSLRLALWNKQGHTCCVCGKEIRAQDGHVDHIVPWDYVGDELENNYQLLCSDCNLHKSNHVALTVHSLIFKSTK
jgi:5-methylcytosine-specific restriction endonuclease McrA